MPGRASVENLLQLDEDVFELGTKPLYCTTFDLLPLLNMPNMVGI